MIVKTANLPQNSVETVIAGNGINEYEKELKKLGISAILSNINHNVLLPIQNHCDLSVNYLGNGSVIIDKSQLTIQKELQNFGLSVIISDDKLSTEYPNDCKLNFLLINDIFIGKYNSTCDYIKTYIEEKKIKIINVNQGYTKCSLCPVSDNAFITDDKSVFKALNSTDFDVLLVKKGSVELPGMNYGFIGGCSFKISEKVLVFCGNIKKHSDYENIKAFSKNYNVELLSLSNNNLKDIGSVIPITEKGEKNEK